MQVTGGDVSMWRASWGLQPKEGEIARRIPRSQIRTEETKEIAMAIHEHEGDPWR